MCISNKSPGRLTFADVTLDRGATQGRDLLSFPRTRTENVRNGVLARGNERG